MHQQHTTQSCGYRMTAFLLSLSILMTSAGQLLTQIPQPVHSRGSIRSIAIVVASLAFHFPSRSMPGMHVIVATMRAALLDKTSFSQNQISQQRERRNASGDSKDRPEARHPRNRSQNRRRYGL